MLSVSSGEQLQTTDMLLSHLTQPSQTTQSRFGLKSTNVFLPDNFEPIEAIILVENEKIADVVVPKETDPEILAQIYTNWDIRDHGNLHIFPGLVDCNVHLHTNFNSEWENITYCTEAAAAGGVTTIIDNPIMTKPYTSGNEYVESLQQRISILKDNCKVDFGVFGILEPKTQDHIAEIMDSGAMGLKCYLLNCMQEGIRHFSSEDFVEILEELEKYKDLLLMIHPEMATERDLYLTSPCRITSLEKRLDKKYVLKPLEFGGAANRGSYLDELCKKSTCPDEDDDDDDCPTATLDTPTKLKGKVKKTQEKTEIDDIVHFELLSYGYNGPKEENNEGSSSDSDDEVSTKEKGKVNSLPTCAEVAETSSDNQEEDGQENQSYLSNLPLKKSAFSRQNSEMRVLRPLKENSEADEEDQKKDSFAPKIEQSPLIIPNEDNLKEDKAEGVQTVQFAKVESAGTPVPLLVSKTKSLDEPAHPLKIARLRVNHSEANKTLNQTRKLLSFLTVCDAKKSLEKNNSSPQPVIAIEGLDKKESVPVQEPEKQEVKSASAKPTIIDMTPKAVTTIIDTAPKISPESNESAQENALKSQADSPSLSSRPMTPASSSLLQRRMSRKSSHGIALSASSTLSSPSSDFTKVNSLEVIKSPGSLAKKEAKYNQSYRIFLANRPQNWEENAVSLVLASLKPDTNLRVLLPNLSLASSFLKVRQKKKSHESLMQRIFSDASPAHLFFNEKMVKKGDTKYKVSPPFRNKENRRLLVENFRLGGMDLVSSYHFYVPPRFKNIDDGNFRRAFGGLDTMGCSLQAVWTAAYSHQLKTNKKFSEDLIYQKKIINHILWQMYRSMCYNPSQMLKIGHKKGAIAKGRDADLVVWDPYKIVDNNDLAPNHVFAGRSLLGTVSQTYLRGNLIFDKENDDQVSKDYRAEFLRPE